MSTLFSRVDYQLSKLLVVNCITEEQAARVKQAYLLDVEDSEMPKELLKFAIRLKWFASFTARYLNLHSTKVQAIMFQKKRTEEQGKYGYEIPTIPPMSLLR